MTAFSRYGFLKRNGLAFLAAPLGRVAVTPRPNARLLDDPPLTAWLDQLRRACRDKDKTPARYQTALRQIDRAMFDFANRSEQGNDAKYLADVLVAVGRAERTLAGGQRFCKANNIKPIHCPGVVRGRYVAWGIAGSIPPASIASCAACAPIALPAAFAALSGIAVMTNR